MGQKYDWLIVGAGFTGAVLAERVATQLGQTVLLVDRRGHIGGNAYDCFDSNGVLVHKYGPHLFHTNSQMVWDYLSQFTEWRSYSHKVLAEVDGMLIPVPFNLNSLAMVFPQAQADHLQELLIKRYGYGSKTTVLRMLGECTGELQKLAQFVYDKIFVGYTTKQWGLKPEELSASVTGRVPIVVSNDDRYFHDQFQAMPAFGYTQMFERMLSNPNIHIALDTDYRDVIVEEKFARMVYTGPIDSFFDYTHGHLPYRSLRFDHESVQTNLAQPVSQINYPNQHDYTRTVEYKHITGQELDTTTIVREYPQEYQVGRNEPFYPIPKDAFRRQFSLYRQLADELNGRVVFAGRLADYQYYNMDQVVARALAVFEQEVCSERSNLRRGRDAQPKSAAA